MVSQSVGGFFLYWCLPALALVWALLCDTGASQACSATSRSVLFTCSVVILLVGFFSVWWTVLRILKPASSVSSARLPLSRASETSRCSPPKHVAVIYNPKSGTCRGEVVVRTIIAPRLEAAGASVSVIPTERFGHGRDLGASDLVWGADAVVVVGGDGTLHEVVAGIDVKRAASGKEAPPLAVVPLGSGNALAADFRRKGLKGDLEVEAASLWASERVMAGYTTCVDTMEVVLQGRKLTAVSMVFLGMLNDLDFLADRLRCMGPARFDVTSLWSILRSSAMAPCQIQLTKPDGSTVSLISGSGDEEDPQWVGLAFLNVQHLTGDACISPRALLDDGVAELLIFKKCSHTTSLNWFLNLSKGIPAPAAACEVIQFTSATVKVRDGTSEGLLNVDGQNFVHNGSLNITLRPASLRLFYNPSEDVTALTHQPEPHVPAHAERFSSKRWLVLVLYSIASMCNQIVWISFAPIADKSAEYFQVKIWVITVLSGMAMVVFFFSLVPSSTLIETRGLRCGVLWGFGLTALGAVIRVAALCDIGHFAQVACLFLGQLVSGWGQPMLSNLPPKLAHEWFPEHQRAVADAISSFAQTLGAAVGVLLPALLSGIEETLMVEAALVAALFAVAVTFFPALPPRSAEGVRDRARHRVLSSFLEALRDRRFWILLVAFGIVLGTVTVITDFLEEILVDLDFPDPSDNTVFCNAVTVAAGLLGSVVVGVVLDKTMTYTLVLRLCFICGTAAWVVLTLLLPFGTNVMPLVLVACAVLGFALFPVIPTTFEMGVHLLCPKVGESVIAGLCMTSSQTVGLVALGCLTPIFSAMGGTVTMWCITAILGCGALAVIVVDLSPVSNAVMKSCNSRREISLQIDNSSQTTLASHASSQPTSTS